MKRWRLVRSGPGLVLLTTALIATLTAAMLVAPVLPSLAAARPASPLQAQTQPSSGYREAVTQALASLQTASAASDDSARDAAMQKASAALERVEPVTLPSGSVMTPDNAALIRDMRAGTLTPDEAKARLTAVRDALDTLQPTDSTADRAVLSAILGKPPFVQLPSSSWLPAWLTQQLDELLRRFFNGLANNLSDARFDFLGLGVLLLVVISIFFLRHMRNNMARESTLTQAEDDAMPGSSEAALGRAHTLALGGNYRDAVRQLYLGTLLILDERGKLRYDRTLTNRETLRAVSAHGSPALADALRPIVDLYDRTWYGYATVAPEEFTRYQHQVEEVRNA